MARVAERSGVVEPWYKICNCPSDYGRPPAVDKSLRGDRPGPQEKGRQTIRGREPVEGSHGTAFCAVGPLARKARGTEFGATAVRHELRRTLTY